MAHGTPAPLLDWARWNGRAARTSATSESGRPPIWERYQRFMKDNPHVLEHALELARTELAAGAKRIGAKALWEKLRARMLKINGGKPGSFKLNNDFTALLARDLIAAEPKLEGKIELRERKTAIDRAVDSTTPLKDDMATQIEQKRIAEGIACSVYRNADDTFEARLLLTHEYNPTKTVASGRGLSVAAAKQALSDVLVAYAERITG